MKNLHYDLIKLLHGKLDDAWRIEKHYLADADCDECREMFEKLLAADREQIEMLSRELKRHGGEWK